MKKLLLIASLLFLAILQINAQEWMWMHRRYSGAPWKVPMRIDQAKQNDFVNNGKGMNTTFMDTDSTTMVVPFSMEKVDSISFADELADEEKGHDKYRVFAMHITTLDNAPIVEKELWINCHIAIDGMSEYSDYSGLGRIRGRGNSTWAWYDKKPYKFKLNSKSKLLGLDKAKNWNLLANYRDVTDLMNAFAFEAARCMGMPHTNHTRFVEVFLNGDYIGQYQLTEKLEVGQNRVNIDEEGGVMLSFDLDDGPSLSPEATDNFNSEVFGLPMCLKHPEDPSPEKIAEVKADLAVLEQAIADRDFERADSLMDIDSYIHILQMHEFLYNVEIAAPRSLYMYKDKGGKYVFGPVWDWDAGYDFDWSDMTTGHTFFTDYRELIYGTEPATHKGAAYSISPFWTNLFYDKAFVSRYKELWSAVSDTLVTHAWGEMEKYIAHMNTGTIDREFAKWPLKDRWGNTLTAAEETRKMKKWLDNRLAYLNDIIAKYPAGSEKPKDIDTYEVDKKNGVIYITKGVEAALGYGQIGMIKINESDVTDYLGSSPTSLTALNTDGTKGDNTAAKRYGAWFDEYGDTNSWYVGHVYIESDEYYSWSFGSHPENCHAGDTHTVTMQFANRNKKMNVVVRFVIR